MGCQSLAEHRQASGQNVTARSTCVGESQRASADGDAEAARLALELAHEKSQRLKAENDFEVGPLLHPCQACCSGSCLNCHMRGASSRRVNPALFKAVLQLGWTLQQRPL